MMIPHMNVLIKPASDACNMRCAYCFYTDEANNRSRKNYGMMTYETLSNIVRKSILGASQSVSFAFQGGEPTLRGLDFFKELMRLEHKFNRRHIPIHNAIQTNGYHLTGEWCQFFHDNHFLVGLSIDGTKELHDAYRRDTLGQDTFDRICTSAKLLTEYEVDFNILTVVNADLSSHAAQIYHDYRARGWNYMQFIPCLAPLNPHPAFSYAPDARSYGQFLCDLFDCWYPDVLRQDAPYIRTFENYLGILLGAQPESCDMRGTCSIQHIVEADGSVYPCDFFALDEYYIGNFNRDTLADISRNRQQIQFIERSQQALPDACCHCPYYGLCRGGCMRHKTYDAGAGLTGNVFCESYRMFFDHCLPRLQTIAGMIPSAH